MAKSGSFTAAYEKLPLIFKVIFQIILGYPFGVVFRVIRFLETKRLGALIGALVALIPLPIWILDIVTEILHGKITVLA